MEKDTENTKTAPIVQADVTQAASLGQTLREAREKLGLSIAEVAGQIKFAPRQIEALEGDDFKSLPEMAFVRGFVRSYAKILRLDSQALLANLTRANEISPELTPPSVGMPYPDEQTAQRQNLILLGAALLLAVLVVIFAVWNFTSGDVKSTETKSDEAVVLQSDPVQSTPDVPAPAETEVAKGKPVKEVVQSRVTTPASQLSPAPAIIVSDLPPNPGFLRMEFDEESWIEVKDRDGNILLGRMCQPGEDEKVEGNMPFSVLVGHAPSVRLYFKDQQVDLTPFTRTTTDVAFLKLK